jgi:hypothetical protein
LAAVPPSTIASATIALGMNRIAVSFVMAVP